MDKKNINVKIQILENKIAQRKSERDATNCQTDKATLNSMIATYKKQIEALKNGEFG